jgi:cell division protein FtsZ
MASPQILIEVMGVGGAGGNIVSHLSKLKLEGVRLVAVNTDAQDLKKANAHYKIQIGRQLIGGLGTGMNPFLGKKAVTENLSEIERIIEGSELLFLAAGFGGGTGTGALPLIAQISRQKNILTVAVVTLPFSFEGKVRQRIAQQGLKKLKEQTDALVVIENDKILSLEKGNLSLKEAFTLCNQVLVQGVWSIAELIKKPGFINVDFAAIKTILQNSGTAFFGIGKAKGEKRAEKAVWQALNSPFFSGDPQKAKGILFVVSGVDISLAEVEEAAEIFVQKSNPETKITFGAFEDRTLKPGELKITLMATGF